MSLIRPLVMAGPTLLNFRALMLNSSNGCLASSTLSVFFLFFFRWAVRSTDHSIVMLSRNNRILIIEWVDFKGVKLRNSASSYQDISKLLTMIFIEFNGRF